MAERRMFAKTIIDSDAFIDMPVTARLLYYDLSMRADDDGFVNSPKKIMRMIGASQDDLMILISKKFLIPFESGVVVIKHWRVHNYIQNDRHKPTTYKEELARLELDENKAYRLPEDTDCIQIVSNADTQDRLGKDRLGKDRLGEEKKEAPLRRFTKPTLSEIEDFINENNYIVNATKFFDYYESNGWKVGRNSMKDWKAAVRSWEAKEQERLREKEPKERRLAF